MKSPASAETAVLVADDEPQLLGLMPRLTRSLVRISGDVLDDPLVKGDA